MMFKCGACGREKNDQFETVNGFCTECREPAMKGHVEFAKQDWESIEKKLMLKFESEDD